MPTIFQVTRGINRKDTLPALKKAMIWWGEKIPKINRSVNDHRLYSQHKPTALGATNSDWLGQGLLWRWGKAWLFHE